MRSGNKTEGFSLIETVVAMLILSLGIVGTQRAIQQITELTDGAFDRFIAQQVARNRAAELALYGAEAGRNLPDQTTVAGISFDVQVEEEAALGGIVRAEITATAEDGPGVTLATFVKPQANP